MAGSQEGGNLETVTEIKTKVQSKLRKNKNKFKGGTGIRKSMGRKSGDHMHEDWNLGPDCPMPPL